MRKKLGILILIVTVGFAAFLCIKIPSLGLDSTTFCASCHVMQQQYDTHGHSAHASLTNCGDCHIPHSLAYGAVEKAYAGAKDFIGVVLNTDPYEIHGSTHGKNLVQANCIRCHQSYLKQVGDTHLDGGRYCFDCHRNTPHGIYPNMPSSSYSELPDLGSAASTSVRPVENSISDKLVEKTAENAEKSESANA